MATLADQPRWRAQQRRIGHSGTFTVFFNERPTAAQQQAMGIEPGSVVDMLAQPAPGGEIDWGEALA